MLVCTFTRTAARDLQGELARLGIGGADDVRAGTLHSFCFGLLSREEVLQLTGRVPRPLLDFEERFLLQDLIGDGFGGIRERDKRLQAFNAAWARLQSDEPGWPHNSIDQAFHRSLLAWLRFHEAILVGELIPETLRYLRDNPASPHRGIYEHVLVDEYQDLNKADQALLDLIAEAGHLMVIGDEDQSIYSWRFAHPEGIANFDQFHTDTHNECLEECRRCPTRVVEMANSLIANNQSRQPRVLRPMANSQEGDVFVLQWRSVEEEAQGIAEFIRTQIQNGQVEAGQILILSPRRHLGYAIRNALNNFGVHAHSFFYEEALEGNPKEIAGSEAQQAFTLLTLLANRADRVALRCWCGFGSNSLQSGAWTRLRAHCEYSGESAWEALELMASGDLRIARSAALVPRFQQLQQLLAELQSLQGQALVDAIFPVRAESMNLIRSLAAGIEGDDFGPTALREALRVGITQPELPTDVDYVRVMSLHKSKGLTAKLVVVVGCIDGLIPQHYDPNKTALTREQFEQEQRRLFYVAITRTTQTLVLSSVIELPRDLAWRMGATVTSGNNTHARSVASRFLHQLGPARPNAVLGSSILS